MDGLLIIGLVFVGLVRWGDCLWEVDILDWVGLVRVGLVGGAGEEGPKQTHQRNLAKGNGSNEQLFVLVEVCMVSEVKYEPKHT